MPTQTGKKTLSLFALGAFLVLLVAFYWQAGGADITNPRGNFWRVVRHGIPAYTSTPAQGHTTLIVNSGENWREFRSGFIMPFAQWLIVLALVAIGTVYGFVGSDKLEKPRSGVKLDRYASWERLLHWYTAALFIIMAVTGLSLLRARLFLIPVLGHEADSAYLQFAKVMHNYSGPLLLIGIILEFVSWASMNIPKRTDWPWLKNMGGMLGKGPPPHTGKVNIGQKGWFWLVVVFGAIVGVTGVLLDFPIWGQTRFTMQMSHAIHVICAVLFVSTFLGHVYMGSIGVEGVFEGMWKGSVDTVWAQQHADLWYQEEMRETEAKTETSLA